MLFWRTEAAEPPVKAPRGALRTLCSSLKYVLLLIFVPPFMNYAALQREGTELKPLGSDDTDYHNAINGHVKKGVWLLNVDGCT